MKVLPSHVAADPERLARFQREAEVLASLNPPNIAAIYGLEEADSTKALSWSRGRHSPTGSRRGRFRLTRACPLRSRSRKPSKRPTSKGSFTVGNAELLFEGPYLNLLGSRTYDVAPDGERFVMVQLGSSATDAEAQAELIIVQNWFEELRRLVPTN